MNRSITPGDVLRINAAIRWLNAEPAAVSLVLELEDRGQFAAVSRDGQWLVAGSQAEAQMLADSFGRDLAVRS